MYGLPRPASVEIQTPVQAMQTYQLLCPPDRTVRTACEDAGCLAWRYGWETRVDESTAQGQFQASYIRARSGRTFREYRSAEGLTVFRFESGQRCFAEHKTRPEVYRVFRGDRRRFLGGIRVHARAADWVEDFGEHQQRIADQREKG